MISMKAGFGFIDDDSGYILRNGCREAVPEQYREIVRGLYVGITDERDLVRFVACQRQEDPDITNWLCVQFVLDYADDLMQDC